MKKKLISMLTMIFSLQYFAEAGDNINATENMVNAYTGVETPRTSSNDMATELKAFYDTELLENARAELYYAQFGKRPQRQRGVAQVEHL